MLWICAIILSVLMLVLFLYIYISILLNLITLSKQVSIIRGHEVTTLANGSEKEQDAAVFLCH